MSNQTTYAVDIWAIQQPEARTLWDALVAPVTPNRQVVETKRTKDCIERVGSMALVLECDTERAEAIVATIRMKFPEPHHLPCYRQDAGRRSWKQV